MDNGPIQNCPIHNEEANEVGDSNMTACNREGSEYGRVGSFIIVPSINNIAVKCESEREQESKATMEACSSKPCSSSSFSNSELGSKKLKFVFKFGHKSMAEEKERRQTEEADLLKKLEGTKKRIRDGYLQAAEAKKQRRLIVIDPIQISRSKSNQNSKKMDRHTEFKIRASQNHHATVMQRKGEEEQKRMVDQCWAMAKMAKEEEKKNSAQLQKPTLTMDPKLMALKLQASRGHLRQSYQTLAANKQARTIKVLAPKEALKRATGIPAF